MNLKLKIPMILAGIVTLILVSGCVEKTQQNNTLNKSSSLFFPVQKNQTDECMDALLEGELVLDDKGCLRVNENLIVWPYGFSAVITKEGRIQVIDDKGNFIAYVGDKIRGGGGYVEAGDLPGGYLANLSAHLPNDRCPCPYFIICKYDITVIKK